MSDTTNRDAHAPVTETASDTTAQGSVSTAQVDEVAGTPTAVPEAAPAAAEATPAEAPAADVEVASVHTPPVSPEAAATAVADCPTHVAPASDEAEMVAEGGPAPEVPTVNAPSPEALAQNTVHAPSPEATVPSNAPAPSPAAMAAMPHAVAPSTPAAATGGSPEAMAFGRVAEDGTVFVRTPDGEQPVGSYPGATAEEALSYFARKYDEVNAQADLLLQRVTQTDLSTRDAGETLGKLRTTVTELRAVGDLAALAAKVENIATALEARRTIEAADRAAAKEAAREAREKIVVEAETIAGTEEKKVQWKSASTRMRELLDEWKTSQRQGARLDRDVEQALWHRLSTARNSFDKMRRVHFAQLSATQNEAKARKEELVAEAEKLSQSTEWGTTAGAFKRLMDQWRTAGRASRQDDDALWSRFKAAQDAFFAAKDQVVAAENEEFTANLKVKEALLEKAHALLPITDVAAAKAALRNIQDEWDAAGKVPRADMDRIERGIRKVEAAVREADQRKWQSKNPEVQARAQSLVDQLEAAVAGLEKDLETAKAKGDARKIAKAQEALDARLAWLEQARTGLAEFS